MTAKVLDCNPRLGPPQSPTRSLSRIRPKTWNGASPFLQSDDHGIPYGSGLHRAVLEGRSRQVRLLVSFGANVDKRDVTGRTPVMLVAWIENDKVASIMYRALVGANADLNARDSSGRSLLSHACIQGRTALVRWLLREDSIAINSQDVNGNSPLNLAAMGGFVDIVTMLLGALKLAGLGADLPNKQGCTALLLATQNGHYECAQILLEEGRASLNSRDNKCFMNPIEWAHHSRKEQEREIKNRLKVMFGRGEAQQTMKGLEMLPNLGFAPRKFIPPFHSVAHELGSISLLRDHQTSLTKLIDSFESREGNDSEAGLVARSRPLSSAGCLDFDDVDTCLLDDSRSSSKPISKELPNIFRLYGQQLFIRKPQPIAEREEPEVPDDGATKPRPHLVRRQSTVNFTGTPQGRKKSIGSKSIHPEH